LLVRAWAIESTSRIAHHDPTSKNTSIHQQERVRN